MIISRTPLRISLAGGGSDLPVYFKKKRFGKVISLGINKYLYIIIKKQTNIFDFKYKIRWSRFEQCNDIHEIKHPIIREVLKFFDVNQPLEICTFSDVPISSGLGSSSTFCVGLINAILALKNVQKTKGYIADLAADLEINKLNRNVGKQDHYAASYGGINEITFFDDDSVDVSPVFYKKEIVESISKNFLLVYTHQQRNAAKVIEKINFKKNYDILKKMIDQVSKYREIFEGKKPLWTAGNLLDQGWSLKKSLSGGISNKNLNSIYNTAKKYGSLGGKICGAGGGGFMLLYANQKAQVNIKKFLKKLTFYDFNFDLSGSRITYYDERD